MQTYQFIDCGNQRRLERFGTLLVDRPAPAVVNSPALPENEWHRADLYFDHDQGWIGTAPENWHVVLNRIVMRLRPASKGQVGIFPEHHQVSILLAEKIHRQSISTESLSVLNLFAHTGLATIALSSLAEVNEVTHVDAAKTAVKTAKENAVSSGLQDRPIRWIPDDAVTYMSREERRGRKYSLVLADPPSHGRDKKSGKEWRFDRDIEKLIELANRLVDPEGGIFCLTFHTTGKTVDDMKHKVASFFPRDAKLETRPLSLTSNCGGNPLPCGNILTAEIGQKA
jgi:Predicted SAM-dependent methyltransferases